MPKDACEPANGGEQFCTVGEETADIALVTYGRLYFNALSAAEILAGKGLSVKIIKLGRIKPLPKKSVDAVLNCRGVFFFEEGMRRGGAGEGFAAELLERGFGGKYSLTAVDDEFVPHASVGRLMEKYSLDARGMARVVEEGMGEI